MRNNRKKSFFWYALLCISLIGASQFILSDKFLETASSYIVYPILLAQHKIVIPLKNHFDHKRTLEELEKELSKLHEECGKLYADNVELQSTLSFIKETDELIQFKKKYELSDAILSHVLIKNFSEQSHYFLIDKGAQAGIKPDMVAIYNNCLLGKIVEVFPQYSKLLLISDRQCKVAAYCAHTQSSGIHEGDNTECESRLNFISHLADIEENDLVLSSGDGLIFPKGFALGKIKETKVDGLFHVISVELPLDLRSLKYCFIIQKGNEHMMHGPLVEGEDAENQPDRKYFLPVRISEEKFAMMQAEYHAAKNKISVNTETR